MTTLTARRIVNRLPRLMCTFNSVCLLLALAVLMLTGCAAGPIPEGRMPPPTVVRPPEATVAAGNEGSLFSSGSGLNLFGDSKARNTGDLLTIVLVESTQASKSATASTSKSSEASLGDVTLLGQPIAFNTGVGGSTTFDGSGAAAQSNKLSGSITVTVIERLPNNVMRVAGEKHLRLNQGDETVRLEGLVRSADITPSNTVTSDRVAEARVTYQGRGALADANAQGWLMRFFNSPWMPF